ncbi:hypothetical protein EV144_1011016 [Flavobacterium sp. 270]|uniref:hypothetical protein n=1 Tax=Flavobacterium sp. 270 TaxID=2512114 RepID=UPI0010650AF2|nr:hypothetical protein [Flavobacterium sp. 270]TDW52327.1 hypothetical protein EV144_1011016 [Flavobacterium sp. 270]
MKKLSFILIVFCFAFASCNNDDKESTIEEDVAKLEKMYDDIIVYSQANTLPCTNSTEWGIIQAQHDACGPSKGYIPYAKKIDLNILQKKIEAYSKALGDYYTKWEIFNDVCQWSPPPTGVECVDGKPKLVFNPGGY